jgi:hypothetical protein
VIVMLALVLLGPTAPALAGGQEVLSDAQDGKIDSCYSRAEFREALTLVRDDQRLYSAVIDTIREAQFSNVAVPGEPCGSGRTVPAAVDAGGAPGAAGLWIGLGVGVGLVAVGAGALARRGAGDGGGG